MQIEKQVADAHRKLSKASAHFLDYIQENKECLNLENFKSIIFDKRFDYFRWQAWPTFINKRTRNEFENAAIRVLDLISKIPEQIFNFNHHEMSHYYEISENITKVLVQGVDTSYLNSLIGRGDFLLSPDHGVKAVEFNLQANLGGWELTFLKSLYLKNPQIASFIENYNINILTFDLFDIFLGHLIDQSFKFLSEDLNQKGELNIAIVIPKLIVGEIEKVKLPLLKAYQKVLAKKNPQITGDLSFYDFLHLKVSNGSIYAGNKRIHTVVEICNGMVPLTFLEPFKKRNLLLYNGPVTRIMTNKLNIALLSEHENSSLFSAKDRESIKKYIPWTRKLKSGYTDFKGEMVKLEDFVLKNRENLILKPAEGLGGKDVFPGRFISKDLWGKKIEQALNEKTWLVQEYIDSYLYKYQRNESDCLDHIAVWGLFAFGLNYGGGMVRVLPERNETGVINATHGAQAGIILEVEE